MGTHRWRVASGVFSRTFMVASMMEVWERMVSVARGIAVQPYRPGVSF